jgi:hypothetical protein
MTTVRTPWGKVTRIEEVSIRQRAGERRFSTVVQLLEGDRGERLVRLAYTTDGVVRRGPVTLRQRDLEKLCTALGRVPALREQLASATEVTGRDARSTSPARAPQRIPAPPR